MQNHPSRYLIRCGRLVTCDKARSDSANPLGAVSPGFVLVDGEKIAAAGSLSDLGEHAQSAPLGIDAPDAVVTPGLVDAHTHSAWMGSRHAEYALRMAGKGYEDIAAIGGGIVASMRAIRAASRREIEATLRARLGRMAELGVTTCEVKSGYGLDLENECKQLEAIFEVGRDSAGPRVVPTYLALHAVPPEGKEHRTEWVHRVCSEWVPLVAGRKLASYVDAYIDRSAFSIEEARELFEQAKRLGLGIRAHIGQFQDIGGGQLAAEFGAASVDHMENVTAEGLAALASAGTRAVLLPVASYTLGQAPPNVAALRQAGISIVVASDANPGTAPTESLPLAMAMAVRGYGLSVAETVLGATREAACSLGLGDTCGQLSTGFDADMVIWNLSHEEAIVQPWGRPMTRTVICRGRFISGHFA